MLQNKMVASHFSSDNLFSVQFRVFILFYSLNMFAGFPLSVPCGHLNPVLYFTLDPQQRLKWPIYGAIYGQFKKNFASLIIHK